MPRTNLVCLQPQKEASGRAQCGGGRGVQAWRSPWRSGWDFPVSAVRCLWTGASRDRWVEGGLPPAGLDRAPERRKQPRPER